MEKLTVRLATEVDCKGFAELLKKEQLKNLQKPSPDNDYRNLLKEDNIKVFVAVFDKKPVGQVVASVADSLTTLIVREPQVLKEYKDKKITSPLLEGMYQYMKKSYKYLARERFVHINNGSKVFGVAPDPLKAFASHSEKDGAPFEKVLQLEKISVSILPNNRLKTVVEGLDNNSTLFALSKTEACKFIMENSLLFEEDTIILASRPYWLQRSSTWEMIKDGDRCFAVHKPQSLGLNLDRKMSAGYESDSSSSSLGSSDSFGQRRRSSTNTVESLHTSLRGITVVLRRLHENLQTSMPKSFSHGRVVPSVGGVAPSTGIPVWEAMIYCEDPSHIRGHIIKQLKAALEVINSKEFVFRVYYNINKGAEEIPDVRRVVANELSLKHVTGAQEPMILYERAFK